MRLRIRNTDVIHQSLKEGCRAGIGRPLGLSLFTLALLLPPASALAAPSYAERPPNFVIILADDLGYGDLSVYGNPVIRTPHLDQMAAEGVRLTNFYAATPTCTPSRAALLTGRYPIRSGMIRVLHPRENFGLPDSEVTLAEALKACGYATACIGKWHLGDLPRFRPNQHGFDVFFGLLYSNDMTIMPPNFSWLRLYRNQEAIESPVVQRTLTQRYTRESIQFIEQNKDRPFFLYLPHTMPHVPLSASKEFRGRSAAGLYGDVVEEIDWSTGQILKTLRDLGLERQTLVVFTSDNGPAISFSLTHRFQAGSPGPLRGGKHTVWEGGLRVPAIIRWPQRLPAGRIEQGIATLMDFFPMFTRLAGATMPADQTIDGYDILPMLQGGGSSPYKSFYYFIGAEIRAVRSGPWKLHLPRRQGPSKATPSSGGTDRAQLYNLNEDISERHDLAASHREIVTRLISEVSEFRSTIQPGPLPKKWKWFPDLLGVTNRVSAGESPE